MKKTKFICLILCFTLIGAFSYGCGNGSGSDGGEGSGEGGNRLNLKIPVQTEIDYKKTDYSAEHTASGNFINFDSSNKSLAEFLNDYTERHSRATSNRVGAQSIGGDTRPAWREWDSMIAGWWDMSARNGSITNTRYAASDHINDWLNRPVQDSQGYIWNDNFVSTQLSDWAMGWEFPNYNSDKGGGKAWGFGTDANYREWTLLNSSNEVTSTPKVNGCWQLTAHSCDSIQIETSSFNVQIRRTPFLRMGFSFEGSGAQDVKVYYQTSDEPTYTEDKSASFKDFCTTGFNISEDARKARTVSNYFFPMYRQPKWGTSYSSRDAIYSRKITKLKIVVLPADSRKIQGTFNLDFVASQFDDRQIINPCNYIIAAKNMLEFSRDYKLLASVLPKARAAMNFLLNQGNGKSGLISTEYFPGHFNYGTKGSLDTVYGIGDGYWDVDSFPTESFYANMYYYNALKCMCYLEDMAEFAELPERKQTVSTSHKDMNDARNGKYYYSPETAASLPSLALKCKSRLQTEFWNEESGRFHMGTYDDGVGVQDHGYVFFNQQAITLGIPTEEQTASILSWINGERTVEWDNSRGDDIYYYEFAPRFNTEDISQDFIFLYSCPWNGNVQNGGTALHNAYYDLVAQSCGDVNTAYKKLQNVQKWYEKVADAGGEGIRFYYEYYKDSGIELQGSGDGVHSGAGLVGVDSEFLEAALVTRVVPDAFFRLSTAADGTLAFAPQIPDGLDWLRIENLTYDGYYYDVSAGKYFMQISGVREYGKKTGSQRAFVQVKLKKPKFDFALTINGVQTCSYIEHADGTVEVRVPLGDCKIEIMPQN